MHTIPATTCPARLVANNSTNHMSPRVMLPQLQLPTTTIDQTVCTRVNVHPSFRYGLAKRMRWVLNSDLRKYFLTV